MPINNPATITSGNLSVVGNLDVTGTTTLVTTTTNGVVTIDISNTEALLIRKDADGGDIFTVDTTNNKILFPTSGAILDFNAGDITITHSAEALTFAGGTIALGTTATATTINGTSNSLTLHNKSIVGTNAKGLIISPTWSNAATAHTTMYIDSTQTGGATTVTLHEGLKILCTHTTSGTVTNTTNLVISTPVSSGTLTTAIGIDINDQSLSGGNSAFGIRIASQTANATTTRAIEISGTGQNNAIRFGASVDIYSNAAASLTLLQPVATTGSPTLLTLTGGAHTTLTASTEAIDVNINLARTVQFATGAITNQRAVLFQMPTYGFVGASTITNAIGVEAGGLPQEGTNATFTNCIGWSFGASGATSAAGEAVQVASEVPGIASGVGAATSRFGFKITGATGGTADVSLGNQTNTLTNFYAQSITSITVNSTTNTRTVTNFAAANYSMPSASSSRVIVTNASTLSLGGNATIYSASAATNYANLALLPHTLTLGSTTQLTGTPGVAQLAIPALTVNQSGGAVTIDNGASLYVAGAISTGASVTITNNYALWVDSGISRFDATILLGATAVGSGDPTNLLVIGSGTAPGSSPNDSVTFYSSDISVGNTEPSFYCEGTSVLATGQADSASSVRVKMRINGTEVTLLAI